MIILKRVRYALAYYVRSLRQTDAERVLAGEEVADMRRLPDPCFNLVEVKGTHGLPTR